MPASTSVHHDGHRDVAVELTSSLERDASNASIERNDRVWVKPDEENAKMFMRKSRMRDSEGQPFKFEFFDSSCLRNLGQGMSLYFNFLKLLILVFFIQSLLSLPMLVFNVGGTVYEVDSDNPQDSLSLGVTTLGNLFKNQSLWVDKQLHTVETFHVMGNDYQITTRKLALAFSLLDLTGVIVFVILVKLFAGRIDDIALSVDINTYTCGDFTVWAKGIPPDVDSMTIQEHFQSEWGKVRHVILATHSAEFLTFMRQREVLELQLRQKLYAALKAIQVEKDKLAKYKDNPAKQHHIPKLVISSGMIYTRVAKYLNLVRQIRQLEGKLSALMRRRRQAESHHDCHAVFIMFEEEESLDKCVDDFSLDFRGAVERSLKTATVVNYNDIKRKRILRQDGQEFKLRAERAPEPTNIIYENLEVAKNQRLARRFITGLITFFLIVLSFLLIWGAKTYSERAPKLSSTCPPVDYFCPDLIAQRELNSTVPIENFLSTFISNLESLKNADGSSNSHFEACSTCFCRSGISEFSNQVVVNSEFRDYCWDVYFALLQRQTLLGLAIGGVVIINVALKVVLRRIVSFEKHHTRSKEEQSIAHKIFVAQFVNTAVITLLVNARISQIRDRINTGGWFVVFDGKYPDFVNEWFQVIGASLMITMISNMFQSIIPVILVGVQRLKQTVAKATAVTNQQLCEAFEGMDFELAARYGIILNTVFVCMLYSPGMPLFNIIGFFTFVLTYLCDKYFLLRAAKKPPNYDERLASFGIRTVQYAVVGHCLVSMWTFSALMPREPLNSRVSAFVEGLTGNSEEVRRFNIASRLFNWMTFPTLVFLFLFLLGNTIYNVLYKGIIRKILKRQFPDWFEKESVDKNTPAYGEAIRSSRWTGPHTYELKHNPIYRKSLLAVAPSDDEGNEGASFGRKLLEKILSGQDDDSAFKLGQDSVEMSGIEGKNAPSARTQPQAIGLPARQASASPMARAAVEQSTKDRLRQTSEVQNKDPNHEDQGQEKEVEGSGVLHQAAIRALQQLNDDDSRNNMRAPPDEHSTQQFRLRDPMQDEQPREEELALGDGDSNTEGAGSAYQSGLALAQAVGADVDGSSYNDEHPSPQVGPTLLHGEQFGEAIHHNHNHNNISHGGVAVDQHNTAL